MLWELQKTVDVANTIITHDAGSPRDQLMPFWKTTQPFTYIGWGKTTQLGYGLGLAMGAKLVHPDKLCINVWGDAAIGFTGTDSRRPCASACRSCRSCSTTTRWRSSCRSCRTRRRSIAPPISPGTTPRWREAFGGYGERVTELSEIVPAIKRGIEQTQQGKPALLEFMTAQETRISKP